ncbi:MAG: glycosyltransferase family 2 protein [Deltaproteobacteria bacterium]|nr:glycosyltransferase family 2 protein [Deltaproteobacteria bacterium]
MRRSVLLLCTYAPRPQFLTLIRELIAYPFAYIVVVDDGSPKKCEPVFEELVRHKEVRLFRHSSNLGIGAAIKTGFRRLVADNDSDSIICSDADGQHAPGDVWRVTQACERNPEAVVLGSRVFSQHVPLPNRIGNLATARIFEKLKGVKLRDTQTGLRGFPAKYVSELCVIPQNRYDYETAQLLKLLQMNVPIHELEIATIYNDDRDSHFNPLLDFYRIYRVLFDSWWGS